jgi:hypothetical protein
MIQTIAHLFSKKLKLFNNELFIRILIVCADAGWVNLGHVP